MRPRAMVLTLMCLSMMLAALHQPTPAAAAETGDWDVRSFLTYDISRPFAISMATGGTDHTCIAYNDEDARGLACARWTGSAWARTVVDTYFFQLQSTCVAVDPEGHPRIAYWVEAETPATSFQVRLATFSGSAWTTQTVADMGNALMESTVSIALDANDLPRLVYYDTNKDGIVYAEYNGVKWSISKVSDASHQRGHLTLDAGGRPYVCCWSYLDDKVLLYRLDGTSWVSEAVDTVTAAGYHISMAVDGDGHPHIAYHPQIPSELRYAAWTGSKWEIATVDAGVAAGEGVSIALDGRDRPHISYLDPTSRRISYAMLKNGQWVEEAVAEAVSASYGTFIGLNSTGFPRICWENWTGQAIYLGFHVPNKLPTQPARPTGPALGLPGAIYSYATHATDPDNDSIEYIMDWGEGNTTRSKAFPSGDTVTLPHRWDRSGSFPVKVVAIDEYGGRSIWSLTTTVLIDNLPNVPDVPQGPAAGAVGEALSFMTSAIDPDGDDVKYVFELVAALGPPPTLTTIETATVPSGGQGSASHRWDAPGCYTVRAKAIDALGMESPWSAAWEVVASTPPTTPGRPGGPALLQLGQAGNYTANATDADGDRVSYVFDWNASSSSPGGSGTTIQTDPVASGTAGSASHYWSTSGVHAVKVRAVDEHGVCSAWSDPLDVTINTPPRAPAAPTGPARTEAGKRAEFTASANDTDSGMVKYVFYWDDSTPNVTEETGFFPSGTPAKLAHTWKRAGTYQVRVRAVDSQGGQSDWSAPLEVVVKAKKSTPGAGAAAAMAAIGLAMAALTAVSTRGRARRHR